MAALTTRTSTVPAGGTEAWGTGRRMPSAHCIDRSLGRSCYKGEMPELFAVIMLCLVAYFIYYLPIRTLVRWNRRRMTPKTSIVDRAEDSL